MGCVSIENMSEVGTGTQIIQGKRIVSGVTVGAGAVVVWDLLESGIYMGIPAKRKWKHREWKWFKMLEWKIS